MSSELEKLQLHASSYREAVDRIFSPALKEPADWQESLRKILICASQLYLDYLLITEDLPAMEAVSSGKNSSIHLSVNIFREKKLREELQQRLESSDCWNHRFKPENAFSDWTGLRCTRDYTERLVTHLPEIYGESFRVEACAKEFLASHRDRVLADLVVGLQHLGRNHISFVLQTLEWAADDLSWEDS